MKVITLAKVAAACLPVAMVVAGASARPAQATASGCSVFSEAPIIQWPSGWLCFDVNGSGESISSMRATWRVAGSLCNWRIDWAIYKDRKTWWRDNGPRHGCNKITGQRLRGAGRAPDGSEICAELYNTARNQKIDAVCHGIVR